MVPFLGVLLHVVNSQSQKVKKKISSCVIYVYYITMCKLQNGNHQYSTFPKYVQGGVVFQNNNQEIYKRRSLYVKTPRVLKAYISILVVTITIFIISVRKTPYILCVTHTGRTAIKYM